MRLPNQYFIILFLCFLNLFYAQDKIELELFIFELAGPSYVPLIYK